MSDDPDRDRLLRAAIDAAASARANGNHPFGAVLVDGRGEIVLTGENTVVTDRDVAGHAELNLLRDAVRRFERDELATMTMYASTEPCPMCTGAVFWSGLGGVVFALGEVRFYELFESLPEPGDILLLHAADVLGHGSRPVSVDGPHLEDEAIRVHDGFWNT